MIKKSRGVHWRGSAIPIQECPAATSKLEAYPWPKHESGLKLLARTQAAWESWSPSPNLCQTYRTEKWVSCHVRGQLSCSGHITSCERSWFRAFALLLPPSLINIYIYIFVCIRRCIDKFGPGVDPGSQPISANRKQIPSARPIN